MKKLKQLVVLCAAAAGLALAGCSTPDTRIAANPAAFAALNPQQQALVKAGQVGIGMNMDAVKLALGDPDRVTLRTDAAGETQVWHYVTYEADGVFLYSGFYHRGYGRRGWGGGGGWWGPDYPYYLDFPNRQVHDRFTVEFRNGLSVSVSKEIP
jgi:outer membrane protein assembly factor BamE (lipoprotein component of BamABCDE complex)